MTHRIERVVVVNDSSIAHGGAEKLALQLAHGLSAQGVPVTFFAGDKGDEGALSAQGIDHVSLGGARLLDSRRSLIDGIYNRDANRALSKLIADIDAPGVVYHVHSWAQILSPSIFDALAPVADRTVVTAHDFFLACPNGNFSIYPKSKQCALTPLSPRCVLTDCDKRNYAHKIWRVARQAMLKTKLNYKDAPFTVLAIHGGTVPFLVRGGVPESSVKIMLNPAAQSRAERVTAENYGEALYIGRLEHEKGTDLLAAAARDAGVPLRVIGKGSAEDEVRRANPDAIFDGWRERGEITEALAKARFLVVPSRCTEPFGLAAAEALRAGVPVIVSKTCLIGDDVERTGMGAVCDVFDRPSFVSLLSRWATDNGMVKEMSMRAFRSAGEISQTDNEWLNGHIDLFTEMIMKSAALER